MCGIFCIVSKNEDYAEKSLHNIHVTNGRRGPDYHDIIKIQIGNLHVIFASWVLHMRGIEITPQPAVSHNGNILLFNGEIFSGLKVERDENDVSAFLQQLDECTNHQTVANVIESVEGPWSLVYYQKSLNRLWFGRDYFGRRSLLISTSFDHFTISSVTKRSTDLSHFWTEVHAGLYCIDFNRTDLPWNIVMSIPWVSITNGEPKQTYLDSNVICKNVDFSLKTSITTQYLDRTFKVENIFPIVDVVNKPKCLLEQLLSGCEAKHLWPVCKNLLAKLRYSVSQRTSVVDSWGPGCKVGILFSGGIDCTVLALLANEFVSTDDPIDLLNVAFEQKQQILHRKKNDLQNKKLQSDSFSVPDRVTGLSSYEELCNLCPQRKWNFVEINITVAELQTERIRHIADLTYPKDTVLDDSIACALWFASRGKGMIKDSGKNDREYLSPAKILLCGLGADEQLGGYSRHRSLYENTLNFNAVNEEIEMEIERIALRNLGRDDRIVSDHSREARFPYLDEQLVGFLSNLPTEHKADYRFDRGVGEKILLRGAAYLLGLRRAAVLPKRAIQFGSRIAKSESRREKGNDKCSRLLKDIVT